VLLLSIVFFWTSALGYCSGADTNLLGLYPSRFELQFLSSQERSHPDRCKVGFPLAISEKRERSFFLQTPRWSIHFLDRLAAPKIFFLFYWPGLTRCGAADPLGTTAPSPRLPLEVPEFFFCPAIQPPYVIFRRAVYSPFPFCVNIFTSLSPSCNT